MKIQEAKQMIETFEPLVKEGRWREDEIRDNVESGSQGGYSPELQKAIDKIEELGKDVWCVWKYDKLGDCHTGSCGYVHTRPVGACSRPTMCYCGKEIRMVK
jgi:DNA invertase Pin-like site-specific DNA recombinase